MLTWIEELDHVDRRVRQRARLKLAACGTSAVDMLIDAMQTDSPRKCYEAAYTLAEIEDSRWVEPMENALLSSNLMLGQAAVRALETRGSRVAGVLIAALPNCHCYVQIQIVLALGRLRSRDAVLPLFRLLTAAEANESTTLRYCIIETLGDLGDPQAQEIIRFFLNDPDEHVRQRVMVALLKLESKKRH